MLTRDRPRLVTGAVGRLCTSAPYLVLTKRSCCREIQQVPTDPLPDWVFRQRQQIGHRIRELRHQRGLSQLKLAEIAGIERKAVYRAELATHSTGIDHLLMIAGALGVPPAALLPGE